MINLSRQEKEYRKFAWLVGGIFALVFGLAIPLLKGSPPRPWLIGGGTLFALAGTLVPGRLGPLYRGWMKLGHVLGAINSFILMHVIFYCIFTPMSLLLRFTNWQSPVRKAPSEEELTYRTPSVALPKKRMEEIF